MLDIIIRPITNFAACAISGGSFFGIPPWYQYLVDAGRTKVVKSVCRLDPQFLDAKTHKLSIESLVLVTLGIIDILLRVGALVAVGFIIFGGFKYLTAQGEPEKAKQALGTIINALVGLGITIVAAAVVSFVGHRIGGS